MDNAIKKQIVDSIPSLATIGDPFEKLELIPSTATFKINGIGNYEREEANKTYFNPDECDLYFFYDIDDKVEEIPFTSMSLEDNKLFFSTDNVGFEILSNLDTKGQLRNHILLAKPYEFNVIEYDSIYEEGVSKIFRISNMRDFYLENVKKDYINTLVFNIRNFNNLLSYFNEKILVDEKFIDYRKMYIKNLKKEIDNFIKINSLDFLYYESDIEDEYFFFIARFYDNVNYVPEILKEDFIEIYG